MTDEWAEGWARHRAPHPVRFIRHVDHDRTVAWIEKVAGSFHGMFSIEAPLHGEPRREIWYANGMQFELRHGQYLVLEGFAFRVYEPDQMERLFDLAEEES